MNTPIDKHEFLGLDRYTWLFSGAETPTHRGVPEAITEYLTARSRGPGGRERNAEVEQTCKANLARLLRGNPEHIALLSNSSETISMIAQGLGLKAGDNVVINTLEFPSGVLPWLAQKANDVEVRLVRHRDWMISVEDILAEVDQHTRLVLTSHVSYLSGHRIDYQRLYHHLKQTQALLLLDATQSLGAVPVNMQQSDFVVCSSYKWLLATHGIGILAVNPDRTREFRSRAIGWRGVTDMFGADRFDNYSLHADARRFELGYPSYPTIYALNFTTGLLLDVGIERIERHILEAGTYLIERLQGLGLEVMTPARPEHRAGNIAFVCSDGEQVAAALLREGILVWGGDGRLRASVHLFNDDHDIERFTQALQALNLSGSRASMLAMTTPSLQAPTTER